MPEQPEEEGQPGGTRGGQRLPGRAVPELDETFSWGLGRARPLEVGISRAA